MSHAPAASTVTPNYDMNVVRQFAIMTVVWGVVGMLVGVIIAAQLAFPALNFDISWLSYGRLRPLHTNAVIFAFGGCGLFASSYYVVQTNLSGLAVCMPGLAKFTFWGWQLVILLAAITLAAGIIPAPRNTPNWNGRLIC
jgi:cytochrome c oxidase cbb3-type subunit 1